MSTQASSLVRLEFVDEVAELTLASPDTLNRFDAALLRDFETALTAIESATSRALLIAAEGRCFSAGGDITLMLERRDEVQRTDGPADVARLPAARVLRLPMPVVCALSGPAAGLGASIALASDVIVSAPGVTISDPHVRFGLVAGDGGVLFWPNAAGFNRARRFLLTGDAVDAREAYDWGLITDLVDSADKVLPWACEIAGRIARLPPLGVQGTKQALVGDYLAATLPVLQSGADLERDALRSDDLMEAIEAFRQKRPGHFHGG